MMAQGGWEGPAIGLMDLDAFFASVEQLDHPEWRGRPVIVGGDAKRRGVVSTASYEARRFGVHSAMPAAQAQRLCPQAIWTRGNFARYREVSRAVMAILENETPRVEQVSIDEAFFDITPSSWDTERPQDVCLRIQRRVAALGVTCSIGLGVCKSVAKVASEKDKPRGLTIVEPGNEAAFLAPLPVRAMSGIGPAAEGKLARLGIRTLGALARADARLLERELGQAGPMLKARAAATERSPVALRCAPDDTKSVSNERTFSQDLTQSHDVEAALLAICSLVGRRLRKKGLHGRVVSVRLKLSWDSSRTAQTHLDQATDDEAAFAPAALGLLHQLWHTGQPVRLLGVGVSDFGEMGGRQLGLFDDPDLERKRDDLRRLHKATDALKDRFGETAISYGRELRLRAQTSDTTPEHKESDG